MPDTPPSPPRKTLIGPSRLRRSWRALTAWAGDHPWSSLTLLAGALAAFLFYGIRLHGFRHMGEAVARWRMEVFGGTFRVDRAVEAPDVILSFRGEEYDRLDALSGSAAFMGRAAYRKELALIAARPGAKLRVVAFDPRLSAASHPGHAQFAGLAAAFGMEPWEYGARCWHSAAALIRAAQEFAPALEVRLLDRPLASAAAPYFMPGRALQLHRAADPSVRLDVLVPRPAEPDGEDSFAHPGLIVRHRPDDAEVRRFAAAFEEAWRVSVPLDAALRAALLQAPPLRP